MVDFKTITLNFSFRNQCFVVSRLDHEINDSIPFAALNGSVTAERVSERTHGDSGAGAVNAATTSARNTKDLASMMK